MTGLLALAGFVAAAALTAALNWLGLRPWRRSAGEHWSARARLLYPVRASAIFQLFLVPANFVVGTGLLAPGALKLAVGGAAVLGTLAGGYFLDRVLFPELRVRSWLALLAVNWLIMLLPWTALLLAILFMPSGFGAATWIIAGLVSLIHFAFVAGLGFHLLRWLGVLRPPSERLRGIVQDVSTRMGVPVRAVWELATPISNALALPVTRQVIFTQKLLAVHPDAEVAAICAHELGHLDESGWVRLARIAGSLALLPLMFIRPVGMRFGLGGMIALGAAATLCWILRLRLSRRMERRADAIAAGQVADPVLYAQALERLYRTNQLPAVLPRRGSRTHPDLYDRVLAVGLTPDFPRPAPPKPRVWTSWLLLGSLVLLLIWHTFRAEPPASSDRLSLNCRHNSSQPCPSIL